MLPTALAVSPAIVDVPPMFSVPVEPSPLVKVPPPVNAVPTVNVPLFVYVPVTANDGMDTVPLIVFNNPLNV